MKDSAISGFPDPLNFAQWWDFCEQPQTHIMQLNTVTAHADADGDTGATLLGVIPRASRLIGAYQMVSANSAGIDANNTSAWVLAASGTTIISKTHTANLTDDAAVDMGTPAVTDLSAGDYLTLAITNGTNADLNSAVCHIALELADYENFPASGLKVIATDGGTCSISDGVKGVCALSPGSTDNDEIYMVSSTETVKFADGEVIVAEAYIQFTEQNTDDANVIFGLMSGVGADALIDGGGGPRASGDYVCLWKVDGGTVWRAGVQSNGTQTPTTDEDSDETAGGSSYQRLKIKVVCTSSTEAFAEFWVDTVNVATIHFTYASATEMQLMCGVKNGGGNAETLNVDYMGYADNRVA